MSAIDVYELSALEKIQKSKCTKKGSFKIWKWYVPNNYKNIEIWSITFKITATNILNRYDLWPNIDLFIESHMNTLQLVKISSIRQIQTSPLPPSSSWFYSSKALCTLK